MVLIGLCFINFILLIFMVFYLVSYLYKSKEVYDYQKYKIATISPYYDCIRKRVINYSPILLDETAINIAKVAVLGCNFELGKYLDEVVGKNLKLEKYIYVRDALTEDAKTVALVYVLDEKLKQSKSPSK